MPDDAASAPKVPPGIIVSTTPAELIQTDGDPKFELLAVNPLGDPCMATPAVPDGMIFVRTQHYLFGIGRKGTPRG